MRLVKDKGLETLNTKMDVVWISYLQGQWVTLFTQNTH